MNEYNPTAEKRTDTELDDRDVRALTEYMTVLHADGAIYSVTTESGSEYRVDAREGRCTCADYEHRDERCKHLRRVAFATGERSIPAWADVDAVDPQLGEHVDADPKIAATDGGVALKKNDGRSASVRPAYIALGVDSRGAHHVYDTTTETVHIVHENGGRDRRVIGRDQTVDEWMDAVEGGWGWQNRRYGAGVYMDRIAAAGGLDR